MFDKDLQEQPFEEELPPVQFKMQISTKITNIHPSSPTPVFTSMDNSFDQFETSLEKELYKHNVSLIKKSVIAYLRYCMSVPIDEAKVFQNGNVFYFQNYDLQTEDNTLQSIINNSTLLNHWKRKAIIDIFNQYGELHGLFRQITSVFPKTITEDFLYIFDLLLQGKVQQFKAMSNCQFDDLLPRMERFWGDQNNQTIIKGGWSVYTQYDYGAVRNLAEEEIEQRASNIFFSKKLKCISLDSINIDNLNNINLFDKFTNLISFISSAFLLTMAGMSQKNEDFDQFSHVLHYSIGKQGRLQEQHLEKRVKSQ